MKRKMINCVMAIVLVLLLIINLLPDMAIALEKNDNTVADYASSSFSDCYGIKNSLYQTKTIETLNGEVDLDFHEDSQTDEGTLEIDGYHWEAASKTLTINGIKKFGIVILPQEYEVTVNVQGDDNYIENLQFKNKDSGINDSIKVTFSGKGTLIVGEWINMSGGDNSSFTVADGVEFIAKGGISIGASGGVNSMVTVDGTLIVQTISEMDVGINAGMLKVGSTGKLSVSGNKGVCLNGMNIDNNIIFENAFYIEEGGQFISDCTEFGIAISFGNCGYGYSVEDVTDKDAEKMLVVPEIDLPVGYKARVAKSRAYGEEGEEYYACAITIGHEKADLKIDDDGRIVGSAGSINIQSHNHVLTNVPFKAATCTQDGNKEYWICNECTRVYSDEQGTTLIPIDTTVILALSHDFTGDFNAYDEDSHWHICKRENCNATDEHQSHDFTKYEYNNNADYFVDGTETAVCDAIGCLQTHTRIKENSKLIDSTAPTGEIKVNENRFKAFINTVTFGIFCNDKYDVTITAEDKETDIEYIEYYISETAISETDIEHVENWTEYKSFSIENEGKYIIYAKITNKVGGVAYISSDGMVVDKTAPAIVGIEDNKTYCHEVTFAVSDDNLDYVTVNNVRTTDYTLCANGSTYIIEAFDKAGNKSGIYTVTVNDGHTFTQYVSNGDATCIKDGTETATCDFCDEKNTRTAVGSKHNHTMIYHEEKAATCTKEGNIEYWNCDSCGKYFADADCTKEMIEADTVIRALGHDFTGNFNAYDENSHWHICNHENCNATDEYKSHHFTKYEYNNNADYFADGTETAVCDAIGCLQTHTRIKENSKLIDSTMPTGEIKVNENRFKAFINTITFGIFCNDKYDVTITAEDKETGIEHIAYYISETAISETDIEHVENWTEYKSFNIENEGKYIIYAKITNKVGGVVYISSDGMVVDKIAPAIVGIEDNKTYCHEVTFTVSDDNLDYVAIDNEIVNNVRTTHYTLIADGLKHTVKVCDKAGNESCCTVTVNDGHTFTQYVSNGDATCMEDGTETAICDFCNEKDTKTAVGSKHGHNYGKPVFDWSDDGKTCKVTFTCENDGKHTITDNGKITSMIKMNPTCTKNGMVSYTITVEFENKIYTDTKDVIIPPIPHNIENKNSKEETCMEEGYDGDKVCTICGEIIEKGTIIPKLNHSYKDGICTVCGLTAPDFRLDELADSPQTSDSSNLMLWITLLFIAGGFFAKTIAYGRKKKQCK